MLKVPRFPWVTSIAGAAFKGFSHEVYRHGDVRLPRRLAFTKRIPPTGLARVTVRAATHVRALKERLARLRALRRIMRDAPDKLRRDAAIISYSRTLDALVEDLMALEDMGLLDACLRRLG